MCIGLEPLLECECPCETLDVLVLVRASHDMGLEMEGLRVRGVRGGLVVLWKWDGEAGCVVIILVMAVVRNVLDGETTSLPLFEGENKFFVGQTMATGEYKKRRTMVCKRPCSVSARAWRRHPSTLPLRCMLYRPLSLLYTRRDSGYMIQANAPSRL